MTEPNLRRRDCRSCPHERCGSCPCVCSPGEHDKPCAVRCEGCGTSSPVELGPEEFCGECKPMTEAPPMTEREQHIADALYLVRVQRNIYQTALEQIADLTCECSGYYKCNGCEQRGPQLAEEALRRG